MKIQELLVTEDWRDHMSANKLNTIEKYLERSYELSKALNRFSDLDQGAAKALTKKISQALDELQLCQMSVDKLDEAKSDKSLPEQLHDFLAKNRGVTSITVEHHGIGAKVYFEYRDNSFTAKLRKDGKWDLGVQGHSDDLPVDFACKNPADVLDSVKSVNDKWFRMNDPDYEY